MQNDQGLLNKGLELFEQGQYAYAYTIFDQLVKENPQHYRANHFRHVCGIKNKQKYPDNLYKRALKRLCYSPLQIYALFLYLIEDNEKSKTKYERLIRAFPLRAMYYKQLIALFQRQNETMPLQHLLEELRLVDDQDLWGLKRLGEIHLKQGNLQQAKQIYDHLKTMTPHDGDVLRGLKNIAALEALQGQNFSSPEG